MVCFEIPSNCPVFRDLLRPFPLSCHGAGENGRQSAIATRGDAKGRLSSHQQDGDPPSGGPGSGVPSQPLPQVGASRPQSQQHTRQRGDLPDQADRLWYDQGHRCSLTHTQLLHQGHTGFRRSRGTSLSFTL